MLVAGCQKDALLHTCVTIGICDPVPPPPQLIEVVCDATEFSSCNAVTLAATLDAALPLIAQSPHSVVRLWAIGADLTDIRPVATIEVSPPQASGPGAAKAHAKQWAALARTVLLAAGTEMLSKGPARRSRIAEAFGEISRADNQGHLPRTIYYVGDRLEESQYGHFECRDLESPAVFLARLEHDGILPQGSLQGARVYFLYGKTATRRCASLARDAAVERLWTAAITHAGATAEFYQQGINTTE
jgi:hypothetical protein